jgi:tetratricopeptide (TPR) repeat protein
MKGRTRAPWAAVIVMAAALVWARSAGASGELEWETRLDRASAAAVRTHQPLLLDFWSATCVPCVEMDRAVYTDERLLTAMAKVRPVRIDIDRDPGIARKYGISGTPTLLLTDSFGRELFRYAGALPLDRMQQLLDALPAEVESINRLSAALTAKKDDAAALSGMGRELRAAGFYRTSSDYYERALRTPEGRRGGRGRAVLLVGLERNALELRLFVDAERYCREALRELGGRPEEPDVQLDLGRALLGQQKTSDARRVLGALIAGHEDTPAATEAARLLAGR